MKRMRISTVFGLSLLLTVSAYAIAPGDIVGAWLFDGDATDSSGNGLDGTVVGGVEFAEGMIGQAINLNGTDAWVEVPDMGTFDQVTVATWAKCTGRIGAWRVIFTVNGWSTGFLHHQLYSNNVIGFSVNGNPGGNDSKSNFMFDNSQLDVWHHLATVYNSNEGWVRFYVDGELDVQNDWGGNPVVLNAGRIGSWDGGGREWQGMFDDFVILSTALSEDDIRDIMENGVLAAPELAGHPSPEDAVVDVPRHVTVQWEPGDFAVSHDVYFGTTFDDVNEANRVNPGEVLISEGQDASSYDLGILTFGQTYYWRVDEVNSAPDRMVFKGDVWRFEVEPLSIPVETITATASSAHAADMGPENTINGIGLDELDQHSTEATEMWLSGMGDPNPSIQYEFDKVYKLDQMLVWNSNQVIESFVGIGAKDVVIEYSVDGAEWTILEGATLFNQAPGRPDYTANTAIGFGGVQAKYVKITVNTGYGIMPQYGLSEMRLLLIPTFARAPEPADGSTANSANVVLGWRTGREAVSSEVYLSTDATDPVLLGTTTGNSLTASGLNYSTTYFWSVTEVNDAEVVTSYAGDTWSFTTPDFGTVDDFEQYNDKCNRIFFAWADGLGHNGGEEVEDCDVPPSDGNGGGSIVGHATAPFAEKTIVNVDSRQSLPMEYDNAFGLSETTLTLAGQDWTASGVQTLSLFFYGLPGNSGQLYVKINNSKVIYAGDAADIALEQWQQWNIDLTPLAGLQNVTSLTIGVDGASAAGMLYIDDIRLYP